MHNKRRGVILQHRSLLRMLLCSQHDHYRDCLLWKSRFQKEQWITNTEQLLLPRLRPPGWDSTFDLFQPFYSASSSSNSTQMQLGHNNGSKLMQQWMKSSSLFHFQLRRTWWWKSDAEKGFCKGHLVAFSAADCCIIKSSCGLIKTACVSSSKALVADFFLLNTVFAFAL